MAECLWQVSTSGNLLRILGSLPPAGGRLLEQLVDGDQNSRELKNKSCVGREVGLSSFSSCLCVSVMEVCVYDNDVCRKVGVLDFQCIPSTAAHSGSCLVLHFSFISLVFTPSQKNPFNIFNMCLCRCLSLKVYVF